MKSILSCAECLDEYYSSLLLSLEKEGSSLNVYPLLIWRSSVGEKRDSKLGCPKHWQAREDLFMSFNLFLQREITLA